MKALLLGSIGTLADTSELQRRAFNEAFAKHGLDWQWPRDDYRRMLRESGGQRRVAAQADAEGIDVDAAAIHATKSELFQGYLADGAASARPGLREAITRARAEGVRVGLVTTTSRANVDALLGSLSMDRGVFDVIVTAEEVSAPKPAPDCYEYAAATLGFAAEDCVAVEDNEGGVRAALAAGMACIAWPNENNRGHDFTGARMAGDDIAEAVWPDRAAAE
ncbi:HAD family phosphatase [Jannaschia sp. W003]|uniref:HAD family hydrolase n=1 Tax=Jannaschia sp. W003 TaxID=2867012 RepID=UPI0021A6CE13|nr:HAD-IA family hydrolase [Jannaschia sp. W003]UWQ22557.1 HAD-IA family hydrolase [Jannaschia sp. W003]